MRNHEKPAMGPPSWLRKEFSAAGLAPALWSAIYKLAQTGQYELIPAAAVKSQSPPVIVNALKLLGRADRKQLLLELHNMVIISENHRLEIIGYINSSPLEHKAKRYFIEILSKGLPPTPTLPPIPRE